MNKSDSYSYMNVLKYTWNILYLLTRKMCVFTYNNTSYIYQKDGIVLLRLWIHLTDTLKFTQ